MSGSRAKALRKANGGFVKHQKQPTPILDAAYIQMPVGYMPDGMRLRYRSPKQVRAYLAKRGVDVDALKGELEELMGELEAKAASA